MRYLLAGCLWASAVAQAQTEIALKTFFEGKKVVAKLDLPAGNDGLEMSPKSDPVFDFKRYNLRLRQNGPSLVKGDSATITAVHVTLKSIGFELSGSRYRILSDDTTSTPLSLTVPKTSEVRQRHSLGNAQLSLLYSDKSLRKLVPSPEQLVPILSLALDFGGASSNTGRLESPATSLAVAKLKTGMPLGQVMNLLGAPRQSREHMEGDQKVVTHTFQSAQESIEVDFVKNLLVNYRVHSR